MQLSQSSNSEKKPASPMNSGFSLNFEMGRFNEPSKNNSDLAPDWMDSYRQNSLLFNRSNKNAFPDDPRTLDATQEAHRIVQAIKMADFGETKPLAESKAGDREESLFKTFSVDRNPSHSNNTVKDRGFKPLLSVCGPSAFSMGLTGPTVVAGLGPVAALPAAEKHKFKFLQAMQEMDPFATDRATPADGLPDSSRSADSRTAPPAFPDTESLDPGAKPAKPKQKIYKTELIRPLESFLMKLFTQTHLRDSDFVLSARQEELLQALLFRKFGKRFPTPRVPLTPLAKAEHVNNIIQTSFKKRPEECYKYFTIRILKFARDSLALRDPQAAATEEGVYEHYFGEAARAAGLPLREFFYPLNKQAPKGAKLNSKYFDKLRASGRFLEAVRGYLAGEVLREHEAEVRQKLFSLLKPHDQFIRKRKKTEEACFADLLAYIERNKHCKFPWTVRELRESQEKFEAMLFAKTVPPFL